MRDGDELPMSETNQSRRGKEVRKKKVSRFMMEEKREKEKAVPYSIQFRRQCYLGLSDMVS